jgi:hypothetical protein
LGNPGKDGNNGKDGDSGKDAQLLAAEPTEVCIICPQGILIIIL